MSAVIPIAAALGRYAPAAIAGAKGANDLFSKKVGYDFFGLIMKIILIYGIAKAIELYVQITSGAETVWLGFIKFLGVKVPTNTPSFLVDLVTVGYNGIKYWHMVTALVLILLFYEWYQVKDNLTPMGSGVFGLLGGFLALTAIPDLLKNVKELQILKVK